jgi:hypothetical protein
MTLVSFELQPVPEGTAVTMVESGFDDLPDSRRIDAFEANDEGWVLMCGVLKTYAERSEP